MIIEPRYREIVEKATLTRMETSAIRSLAPLLPEDDDALDGLLAYLVERRIGGAFGTLVLAALDADT